MNVSAGDVSAVVLTLGEPTTQDAIRAVEAQTLPPHEIVLVENVAPFHRALNQGASRVRTPFFVQIDADMIADPICFEVLRSIVTPSAGIVSGFLRDALLGRICCIKLFRTECFERCPMPDTVAQDSDFRDGIYKLGWELLRALRFDREREEWHTLGEHRRHYAPHYTFHKFVIEGRRAWYRRDAAALRDRLRRLHQRSQEVAVIAQIGLAHGIFLQEDTDLLRPFTEDAEWRLLERFLQGGSDRASPCAGGLRLAGEDRETFRSAYRLGIELRQARDASVFRGEMHALGESNSALAWIAQVGLCHGLFAEIYDERIFEDRFRLLREML
jgi:hypothetical protein